MRSGSAIVVLALLATGCGRSGGAETRDFPVGAFDRVALTGPDDVSVVTGPAASVSARGDGDALDGLKVEVVDGELRVGRKGGAMSFNPFGWRTQRARVAVTVPRLAGARLSGAGQLSVDRAAAPVFSGEISGAGDLRVDALAARRARLAISGAGSMTVAGRADATTIAVSGAGSIQGGGLTSGTLALDMSGVGQVTTAVTGKASGRVSGVGKVRITGTEDCSITASGVGSVSCGK